MICPFRALHQALVRSRCISSPASISEPARVGADFAKPLTDPCLANLKKKKGKKVQGREQACLSTLRGSPCFEIPQARDCRLIRCRRKHSHSYGGSMTWASACHDHEYPCCVATITDLALDMRHSCSNPTPDSQDCGSDHSAPRCSFIHLNVRAEAITDRGPVPSGM